MTFCFKTLEKYFYDLNEVIGCGAYGKVYKGHYLPNCATDSTKDLELAIKEIPILSNKGEADQFKKTVFAEIDMMKILNHKNIVRFVDVKRTDNFFYIITEYCNQGSLASYLKKYTLSEKEIIFFIKQIIEGFKYLYSKKIMHRDVKPENILLHNNVIKLADFGFAKNIKESSTPEEHTIVGTVYYMSPEILAGNKYDDKSDIFSLGITFYFMVTKQLPWIEDKFKKSNQVELLDMIKKKKQNSISFPKNTCPELQTLILGMIRCDKEERLSWEKVFDHPLLKIDTTDFEKSESTCDLFPTQSFDLSIIPESKGDLSHVIARLEFERSLNLLTFNAIKKLQYFMCEIHQDLFMRLNFLMSKKILISFQLLKDMLTKQMNVFNIKQNDWVVYTLLEDLIDKGRTMIKYYKQFFELKKLILNEESIARETFSNFTLSTLKYIDRKKGFKNSYQKFLGVFNEDLKPNDNFDKIYVESIKEFLKSVKEKWLLKNSAQSAAEKNQVYLIDEMWILTDTNFFKIADDEYVNLQKFYELRRQCDIVDIIDRIKEAYNHFNL